MLLASLAVQGFATGPLGTVVTYDEALAAGQALNCGGLHDGPTYAQDLRASFAAHDQGDGAAMEHSQREYESHVSHLTSAQLGLLGDCLGSHGGRRLADVITNDYYHEWAEAAFKETTGGATMSPPILASIPARDPIPTPDSASPYPLASPRDFDSQPLDG